MSSLERSAREIRETCVCTSLRRAARAVTQAYDAAVSGSGVNASQFSVMAALAETPFIPVSKLAVALLMDRTTLSRILALLLRDGLVEERQLPDQRLRACALSPRGKRVFEQALPGWRKAQARVARAVAASELEQLSRTLGRVIAAV